MKGVVYETPASSEDDFNLCNDDVGSVVNATIELSICHVGGTGARTRDPPPSDYKSVTLPLSYEANNTVQNTMPPLGKELRLVGRGITEHQNDIKRLQDGYKFAQLQNIPIGLRMIALGQQLRTENCNVRQKAFTPSPLLPLTRPARAGVRGQGSSVISGRQVVRERLKARQAIIQEARFVLQRRLAPWQPPSRQFMRVGGARAIVRPYVIDNEPEENRVATKVSSGSKLCDCEHRTFKTSLFTWLNASIYSSLVLANFCLRTDLNCRQSSFFGDTVAAERLACSPPTKANRVQSPGRVTPGSSHVGIVPDDAAGRRVFSGISCSIPSLHSGAAPYTPHFTHIGFQDLDVNSRPDLFIHSLNS
ncbi:hypothetical protein PR048_025937 [Dryococelus australis]|uniref:Uncharacterized protein n=1 Tax=Dryococelus australis TaxID=614101 RepID=A0ABQ9GK03_9NEOP|nr:hypothetical protein PR048_025937 [Dryococelus australis]